MIIYSFSLGGNSKLYLLEKVHKKVLGDYAKTFSNELFNVTGNNNVTLKALSPFRVGISGDLESGIMKTGAFLTVIGSEDSVRGNYSQNQTPIDVRGPLLLGQTNYILVFRNPNFGSLVDEYTRRLKVVFPFVRKAFVQRESREVLYLKDFGKKRGFQDFFNDPKYSKDETRIDSIAYQDPALPSL